VIARQKGMAKSGQRESRPRKERKKIAGECGRHGKRDEDTGGGVEISTRRG